MIAPIWLAFISGMVLGCFMGITVMCVLFVGRSGDDVSEG